jgi:hypothetical protein
MALLNRNDAVIAVHDFWSRTHYHILLACLDVIEEADDLVVCRAKKDLDISALKRYYELYKYDPA